MIKSLQTSLKSTENWYKSTAFLLLSKTEQQLFFYTRAKLKALIDLWRNKIFLKKKVCIFIYQ